MRWLVPTILVATLAASFAGLGPDGPGHGREEPWGLAAAEGAPVPRVPRVHVPEVPLPRPPSVDPIPIPDAPVPGAGAAEEERAADEFGEAAQEAGEAGLDLGDASTDDEGGTPITEIVIAILAAGGLVAAGLAWWSHARRGGGST